MTLGGFDKFIESRWLSEYYQIHHGHIKFNGVRLIVKIF